MRIHIPATGLNTYPDIAALCREPGFEGNQFDTLLNPSVIIEVLSSSTEAYDRGAKFAHYRSIESLQAYVMFTQDRPHIELFERGVDGHWVHCEREPRPSEPLTHSRPLEWSRWSGHETTISVNAPDRAV